MYDWERREQTKLLLQQNQVHQTPYKQDTKSKQQSVRRQILVHGQFNNQEGLEIIRVKCLKKDSTPLDVKKPKENYVSDFNYTQKIGDISKAQLEGQKDKKQVSPSCTNPQVIFCKNTYFNPEKNNCADQQSKEFIQIGCNRKVWSDKHKKGGKQSLKPSDSQIFQPADKKFIKLNSFRIKDHSVSDIFGSEQISSFKRPQNELFQPRYIAKQINNISLNTHLENAEQDKINFNLFTTLNPKMMRQFQNFGTQNNFSEIRDQLEANQQLQKKEKNEFQSFNQKWQDLKQTPNNKIIQEHEIYKSNVQGNSVASKKMRRDFLKSSLFQEIESQIINGQQENKDKFSQQDKIQIANFDKVSQQKSKTQIFSVDYPYQTSDSTRFVKEFRYNEKDRMNQTCDQRFYNNLSSCLDKQGYDESIKRKIQLKEADLIFKNNTLVENCKQRDTSSQLKFERAKFDEGQSQNQLIIEFEEEGNRRIQQDSVKSFCAQKGIHLIKFKRKENLLNHQDSCKGQIFIRDFLHGSKESESLKDFLNQDKSSILQESSHSKNEYWKIIQERKRSLSL